MTRTILSASLLTAFSFLLFSAGCSKPAPGGACEDGKSKTTCLDGATQLECKAGKWEASSCLGPKGCVADEKSASCDTSLSKEGDGCGREGNYACTVDKKAQLRCKGGKWASVEKCLGENGCDSSGMFSRCDSSLANEGDICEVDEKDPKKKRYACSVDQKAELLCKDGKWKAIEQCAGEKGCRSGGLVVSCDGPTAKEGDFCDTREKEDYACSADKKAQLKCEKDTWTLARKCMGAKGCSSSLLFIECDTSVVEPGEACDKDGNAACSTDGKTILECKKGKFEKARECPEGCKADMLFVDCK